jgi:hypothetical protein
MSIDELSKVGGEIAKTGGQFVELTTKVAGFVLKVMGPASIEFGGIFEDLTRFYRYKRLLTISDKVESLLARRKIEGKTTPISPRVAIPMLDAASLEDDETLQDVWAKLIANSMDPHFEAAIHPGYIEIVKQMSPDEAIILGSFLKLDAFPILFSNHVPKTFGDLYSFLLQIQPPKQTSQVSYQKIYESYHTHCEKFTLKKPKDAQVYFDNLLRLRVVELGYDFCEGENLGPNENPSISIPARNEFLRMTPFGQNFVTACIDEEPIAAEQL